MCGFAGFLDFSLDRRREINDGINTRMTNAIRHRGPDDSGLWSDIESGVSLGFRRLSIIDLSPNGHQPMLSACGRYTIVFNGEIYNFKELKREILETQKFPFSFRGHSDTEVLLAGFTVWGVETTLPRTNGMFAFAVWDRETRTLILSRDRIGEKPLYYGWFQNVFLFASELRSFQQHPRFTKEIDRNSLALYFRYNNFPAPYTVYKGVSKLTPGTYLKVSSPKETIEPVPYWSVKETIEKAKNNPYHGSFSEALDELDTLLKDSIRLRMESDVPLGAFLSGGVDSSTTVALMQAQSQTPVQTFTIGFNEGDYNEAGYAKAVAEHLGTNHTELILQPQDAWKLIPHLGDYFDEPFADSSQIPTLLVSRLARQKVTVALSGDAGDELFAGYNRYRWAETVWQKLKFLPLPARFKIGQALQSSSPDKWDERYAKLSPFLPGKFAAANPGDKIHKFAQILGTSSQENLYRDLLSHWQVPTHLVLNSEEPKTILSHFNLKPQLESLTETMMALDLAFYLPNDILVKVDRASMRESLEARVPLLDPRIIEFAWRLPMDFKMKNGKNKVILRQLLNRYVPEKLMDRPKMGFAVPIGTWLRGPLREWAEGLLAEETLKSKGHLNPDAVRSIWQEHLSGKRNHQHRLWSVLMFQTWLES